MRCSYSHSIPAQAAMTVAVCALIWMIPVHAAFHLNPLHQIPDIKFSEYGCKLEAAHYKAGESQQWVLTLWAYNEDTHARWENVAARYMRSDPSSQMRGLKDCHIWMTYVEKKLGIKSEVEHDSTKRNQARIGGTPGAICSTNKGRARCL